MLAVVSQGTHLFAQSTNTESSDPLLNALIKKGILTQDEAAKVKADMAMSQSNEMQKLDQSKWKISDAIKSIGLFGDLRMRYEYRSAHSGQQPGGVDQGVYAPRDRFRYSVRFGVKGDVYDQVTYGVRFETSPNPRSPWLTFGGDNSTTTPSGKATAGIYVGQAYLNWHPASYYEMTVGKMPMPLYTTPMVWDNDICPEGAFEKVNHDFGVVNVFADFGQFDYQNPSAVSSGSFWSGDVFLMAWQVGAKVQIDKDTDFKIAPVLYTYTGLGSTNGASGLSPFSPYTGQGNDPLANPGLTGSNNTNQSGLNDLRIVEVPAEFNFKMSGTPLGVLHGRFFGDISFNLQGNRRSLDASLVNNLSHTSRNFTGEQKAYQFGFGVGSDGINYGPTQGIVYGNASRKNAWEGRVYWQHVEQFALDANLLDSDFFEGRGNLEGIYTAFAYSFTDALIGTVRFGYAHQINKSLGTGGNNLDIPQLNPIDNYKLAQFDITLRF